MEAKLVEGEPLYFSADMLSDWQAGETDEIYAFKVVRAVRYDALAAELAAAEKQWNVDVAARGKLLNRVAELEAALLKYGNHFPLECRRAFRHPQFDFNAPCSCGFDAYFALETACDRGRNSCNHENASQCCGGGHDGDCTCKICHPEAQT